MAKIERTKNATRNLVYGISLRIYQILVPFIIRTVMINTLGVQYLGLNSLFTSVLSVLNLAELGVGSAMVYSMYKPIAEDDESKICALMKLYKTYYGVIGLVIAVAGALLTPFIPRLISGDTPEDINIYTLYLLNLAATVLSYWLFAYKNSILQAHQRTDVVSKVTLVTNTIQYILQIGVLCIFKNYYFFIIILLFSQVLTNTITAYWANRIFPKFKPKGNLQKEEIKEINHRIRDLFTSKIGSVVVDSADTIVVSAFLGLTVLAIYQNYFFILTSVAGFITVIFGAVGAGIGNSVIVESKEKNFNDLKKFTFIICWISGMCVCCFLNLYQPFMELWVGRDLMLGMSAVCCFSFYFYIQEVNKMLNTYKDASGIWHEDRFRPLIVALVNLFLNLVMVQSYGIYGILLSTVLATLFVGMPWIIYNLFTTIFEKKHLKEYIKKLLFFSIICFGSAVLTGTVCSFISFKSLVVTLVIRAVVSVVGSNAFYFIIYRKTKEFNESLTLFDQMTNGKLSRVVKR